MRLQLKTQTAACLYIDGQYVGQIDLCFMHAVQLAIAGVQIDQELETSGDCEDQENGQACSVCGGKRVLDTRGKDHEWRRFTGEQIKAALLAETRESGNV